MRNRTIAGLAAVLACAAFARAEKPAAQTTEAGHKHVATNQTQEVSATIEAIDKTSRMITLKGKDGNTRMIFAGPEVKRFDELKVGDTVTASYYESVVYKIRKPGDAAMPATDTAVIPSGSTRPGGTKLQQETVTVTIKAIDAAVPSVTVLTEDGRTVSFKVEDKAALGQVKVGDKVEVTLTQALLISVR